ncbi:MAG TPA: isoprenylcysteine carboxylmethyltransferase family protein [Anaerolineae bacterium]|nr:isoprenylcysteine carboxylmethyltransferase family protein [Anaerolineae bacterium]
MTTRRVGPLSLQPLGGNDPLRQAGFQEPTEHMSTLVIYLLSVAVLLASAFLIFRILVRCNYRERGQLTLLCSLLELAVCLAYASVPYIYNPPCWPYVWSCQNSAPQILAISGYVLVSIGAILGFGSMMWLGLRRSFGQQVTGLYRSGPYRLTRNPQVLGGFLIVTGIALLWPSCYAFGWAALWIAMFHPMVLTEEEHLHRVYGDDYAAYCERVPRYIGWRSRL